MNIGKPLLWMPTLYFVEGLPHVVLVTLTVVMYLQLGMSDTEIAFYTAWLGIPWVLRPFYRYVIERYQAKRQWILALQVLLGMALAGVAFTLNSNFLVQGTIFFFLLIAFLSAMHNIAVDSYCRLGLVDEEHSWHTGVRNIFYQISVVLGKGILVPVAGILQVLFRNQKAYTWSLIFGGLACIFIVFSLYHGLVLPRQSIQRELRVEGEKHGIYEAYIAFRRSYSVKELGIILLFLFCYCLPEGMLFKMADTFLLRPGSAGGIGLSPQEYGLVSGTVGVIGLVVGSILGRIPIRRDGLRHWRWQAASAITLPKIVYVYLSYALPQNIWLVSTLIFIEQVGFGFGYVAFITYIYYLCGKTHNESCRDICTSISYLGLMCFGMVSGYVRDMLGFRQFFIIIILLCVVTFWAISLIKIDVDWGKRPHKD